MTLVLPPFSVGVVSYIKVLSKLSNFLKFVQLIAIGKCFCFLSLGLRNVAVGSNEWKIKI